MNNYYDGETGPTGFMQRIPNWVVRGQDYSEWKPSDIQEIINWGYTDPYSFFGQEGEATRDALSRAGMADSVIADIYANAPVELQAQLGDRYKGTAQRQAEYDQGIRDYTNYVAPRLGAVMAGSLLGAEGLSVAAPWLVDVAAPAIQRAANTAIGRRIRGGLDVLGTIDGIRNAFSDNGLSKTYRLIDEGRYGRAALSGLGDAFDIAGGVGYIRGVGKRGAEAILRMGDEARRAGELWNRAFYDAKSLGKTGLKKLTHVPKYIKDQYKSYGHTSKQLLDKNTIEYIFNPMANPDLAYQMPYNYSGDYTEFEKKGKHQYDRINEFLGKTQPDNVEYVNVDDLPDGIRKWAKERYPGMKRLRVANIGKSRSRPVVDAEIRALGPGDDMANIRRSSTGIMDESRVDMLDPGHHGVDLVVDESGNVYATGHDVYKYNEKDWLKKWKNDFDKKQKEAGEIAKPKTKYQEYLDDKYGEGYSDMSMMGRLKYFGLRFLDRHGSPLIYNWDYGKVGHVPSYNMNPSTKVSMLSPDKDSPIEYINDYIAQKKRALAATSNPYEISDLKDDIRVAEYLKRKKAPVQPYKPISPNPTDIDITPPSHPLPPNPTMESSIDEIDDFIHKMEAELKQAGDPEEYYGILEDLEHAKHLKTEKQLKSGIISPEPGNDMDIDAVKWADEDIDDVDPENMQVFSDWVAANSVKTNVAPPALEKAAKSEMTDEEVSALQDYIKKQVYETKAKMSNGAIKKTQHIIDPVTGEVHEKTSWEYPDEIKVEAPTPAMSKIDLSKFKTKGGVGDIGPEHGIFGMDIDDYKLTPDDIVEMDDATFAKLSKSFNLKPKTGSPDVDEIPWAYGGLLNRMSKFYNNDRSSMLNLVRKMKAGMN